MSYPLKEEQFEKIFKQHLKIDTYSKSIDSLLGPRSISKINFKPYYQRNYVWDNDKATYFIESILMGTEIPPLVFFNNNKETEVIDGRQRFETIYRFSRNEFSLTKNGLKVLPQLKKHSYDDLAKRDRSIIEKFLDANIRVIEFALVNDPPLDSLLEDKVKKEIFSRYNSGITPLKKSEVDNALYDDDEISVSFKKLLSSSKDLQKKIYYIFNVPKDKHIENPAIEGLLFNIRQALVLPLIPITYYANSARAETIKKIYDYVSDTTPDELSLINGLIEKIDFIDKVRLDATSKGLRTNKLVYECLLWALQVLDSEEVNYNLNDSGLIASFNNYVHNNISAYIDQDYHYSKEVIERYTATAEFFEKAFNLNLGIYLTGNPEKRAFIKEVSKSVDTHVKIDELESLRLNKPEPTRKSIEDVSRIMQRRRFLVRPSYQRKEVINQKKASSIIESILLGITLPPIFLYKRAGEVVEVIDGQQRILTILGFIGSSYVDENGSTVFSKNHKFSIKSPRILTELQGKKFDDLSPEQQNKIIDFQLYIVEIDQVQNPRFDPIDLFIRLNDKPYPIREHSFEMWNSWADYDLMDKVKDLANIIRPWFHIKQTNANLHRDRMESEELLTSLSFLDYCRTHSSERKVLDIYQIRNKINARVGDKAYVSELLANAAIDPTIKKQFIESAKNVKDFIKKLKIVLLDSNKSEQELVGYLKTELDNIFRGGKEVRYFRRTTQDFYIAWDLLNDINLEMVKHHRLEIKNQIKGVFQYIKNIPEEESIGNKGFQKYCQMKSAFKEQYVKQNRQLRLNEFEKLELLELQKGVSGLSGSPVFLGDEIEIDHIIPLAIGGADSKSNLQVLHKDENRSKGSKPL